MWILYCLKVVLGILLATASQHEDMFNNRSRTGKVLSAKEVKALPEMLQVTPGLGLDVQSSVHAGQPLPALLVSAHVTWAQSETLVAASTLLKRESSRVWITRTELPQTARMSAKTEFVACLD